MKNEWKILIIDDDEKQCEMLVSFLNNQKFSTFSATDVSEAFSFLVSNKVDLIVSDVKMPDTDGFNFYKLLRERGYMQPVLFITAFPDIRDAVRAMRDGAVNYLEKPIDLYEMLDSIENCLEIKNKSDFDILDIPDLPDNVIAKSKKMIKVLHEAMIIARSDVNIIITGESGTGKEVLADLIHMWSGRASFPFLKINCAAIPESLLESELFGYEKGAFTGASSKKQGIFEQADQGTILLDEITEMPLFLQAKLLRIAQDGSFIPLGSNKQKKVSVRLLAATNRNLVDEVKQKKFREDLFYRLSTFEIYIPPLRERKEDIMPLADFFACSYNSRKIKFSKSVINIFYSYNWPGNVRELQNTVRRAVLMAGSADIIYPEHLPPRICASSHLFSKNIEEKKKDECIITQIERTIILQTLEKNNFNRSLTAKELNMSRRTLTYKLKKLKEAGYNISLNPQREDKN